MVDANPLQPQVSVFFSLAPYSLGSQWVFLLSRSAQEKPSRADLHSRIFNGLLQLADFIGEEMKNFYGNSGFLSRSLAK